MRTKLIHYFTHEDEPASVEVEGRMLGRGMFARAYREAADPSKVVLVAIHGSDMCREVLAQLSRDDAPNPFLPRTEEIGYVGFGGEERAVYRQEYVRKLGEAGDPVARRQARRLRRHQDDAWAARPTVPRGDGHVICCDVVERARADDELPGELVDALERLYGWGCNFTSDFLFEFCGPNLGAREDGGLVLLDPIFNREEAARIRRAADRARRGLTAAR